MLREIWRRLRGKVTSEDLTSGGWTTLWGTDVIKPEAVWETLSVADREQAYRNMDVVYACVREICTTFGEPQLLIGYESEDGFEQLAAHPTLELLERPNKFYTRQKREYYEVARLLLTGETYTWKWRAEGGQVVELWPVPTAWCGVVAGKGSDAIDHYTILQNKATKPVKYADMMYEWLVDPASTTRGAGCLQAAQHAYQMEQERENLIAEQLKHSHIPGLTIEIPEGVGMSPEDKRYLRDALYDKVGKGKRGSPLILSGGAKASVLSILKDLDMPGLAAMDETRICAAFGVPPIVVGVRAGLENAPWSKYSEARKSFYEETMMPLWTSMEQTYTRSLLRDEGEQRLEFRYDTSDLPALQPERREQAEVGAIAYKAGALLKNEYREMLGFKPQPDGDVYQLPINVMEVPVGESHDEA